MLLLVAGLGMQAMAQAKDPIEGLWYNAEKTAKINIFKATDGKFWGEIVWLKEPNVNGKPRTDVNNTTAAKRTRPIMKLQILRHFEKDGAKTYDNGEIYDPKNGKTYDCKITHKGTSLSVRGYVGISMIGRTTTWQRAE
ncbi:DUF2147 domain-containing protein [Taibaiella sp. KBW10]|nr:DUF2147 domain-containing protein [Taibaiella sp. KBW10]